MGISDMLGVRTEKVECRSVSTLEELYEKIKDVPFEAGKPELVKNGFAWIIAFPQLDRNNQVQIAGNKGKFTVMRSTQPAGVGKMLGNMMLDELTDGWSSMSAAFGNTKKLCMELTTKTAETIRSMNL